MSQIRRRQIGGKTDDGIPMYYPSKVMLRCITTDANQTVSIMATATYANVIIDGVPAQGGSSITIPEAGDHTIYFDVTSFNYGTISNRVYYLRLPNTALALNFLHYTNSADFTIDVLCETPYAFNNNNVARWVKGVRVPIGTKAGYVEQGGWSSISPDLITEVKFKLIDFPELEYTKLTYIRTNKKVTGVSVPSYPFNVKIECAPNISSGLSQGYGCIFGLNSNMQLSYTSTGKAGVGNATSANTVFADGVKCTIDAIFANSSNASSFYVDGVNTGLQRGTSGSQLYLGGAENGSSYRSDVNLYSFKLIKDNVVKMDLVPCKRNYDNQEGLFDIINGNFYILS